MSSNPIDQPIIATRTLQPASSAEPRTTVRTHEATISTADALDRAFAGERCELVRSDGTSKVMPVLRWSQDASLSDLELFVGPCHGPTLDVGCGPGRLTTALTERGVHALGIDISREAVRQTRERGGHAICGSVFDSVPRAKTWQHILLADGNIGLGGDPSRLLTRVRQLLSNDGTVLVELASVGIGTVHEDVRLRIGRHTTPAFGWATVGVEDIEGAAASTGFVVAEVRRAAGRHVATLHHRRPLHIATSRR